MSNRPSSDE